MSDLPPVLAADEADGSAAGYLHRGRAAQDKPAALAIFEAGLLAHPDDPDLLRAAGNLLAQLGRHADAAPRFARLATSRPDAPADWVSWAAVLSETRDRAGIASAARQLLEARPSAAEPWYSFASAAAQSGDWPLAEQLFREAMTRAPTPMNIRALGSALMHLRRPREAAELFLSVAVDKKATPADWVSVGSALGSGDPDGAIAAFKIAVLGEAEAGARRLGLAEIAQRMGLNADRAELIAQLADRPKTLPILIVSMPKSGTIYLGRSLSEILGKRLLDFNHSGYFPDIGLPNRAMRTLAATRGVYAIHPTPNRFNITEIEQNLDRIVLHVRDPRQAMISWCHFMTQFANSNNTPAMVHSGLPGDFAAMPFDARLDWLIDNHLPRWTEWAEQWRQVAESGATRFRVLITRHEDLAADPEAFFARLLSFHDIDPGAVALPRRPQAGDLNFRSGETDEWRTLMTRRQQARAASHISRDSAAAFGWPLD